MAEDVRADAAQRSTDVPGFKIGKALVASARPAAKNFTGDYYNDLRFAMGETQWPTPASFKAWYGSRWKSQTVRNYTYATIHHKMAVCLDAEPSIRAEPMDELSTFAQRQDIASVVSHELERLRWNEYARSVMFDGSIVGTGLTHAYVLKDDFTGLHELHLEHVDPCRFYPDPSADRLNECRYVVYEPEMDMSRIRKLFPETYMLVNAQPRTIGRMSDQSVARDGEELVRGAATGEIAITRDGLIQRRMADVCFIWIKDPKLIEDVKSELERGPMPGYSCTDCGNQFDRDHAVRDMESTKPRCPTCNGEQLQPVTLPPEYAYFMETSKAYTGGRLIAMTENVLLSDDASPYDLDMCFPFAMYGHNPITRRFWGYGEVALVRKVQEALNKNIAQGIDYMRLAGNGPLEVPAEVPAYRQLGNMPSDTVPCPAPFMGLARYLSPTGYNVQMHQILDQSLKRDMQEITGVSDVSLGIAPNAPTSGIEVQARQRAASTRIGLHLKDLNQYRSDLSNIVWQLMNQFYTQPMAFNRAKVNGELESIVIECSQLPRNVRVKVSASVDKTEKDKNFFQNLMMAVQAGQVGFYPDLMLPMFGASPEISREIQEREQQRQLQMQQQAMAQQAALGGATQPGGGVASAAVSPTGSQQALTAGG